MIRFFLSLIFVLCCFDVKAADITFKDSAKVAGAWIKLSDVAYVKGRNKEETLLLSEVFLGESPRHREQKNLTNDYLKRRLKQFDFWDSPHRVHLPEKGIQIFHTNQLNRLKETEIEVMAHLEEYYSDFSRVALELEDPRNLLESLPQGLLSVAILDKEYLPKASQEITLALEVKSGEKTIRGTFPAHLHLYKQEVRAHRRLGMRLPIEKSQIEMAEYEILPNQKKGFSSFEEVMARKTSRIIPQNSRLVEGDVLPPILISKGTLVELVQDKGEVQIQFYGKALGDGSLDNEISFEMLNGLNIRGKVVGRNKAHIVREQDRVKTKNIFIGESP